jgi:hypothetical protein
MAKQQGSLGIDTTPGAKFGGPITPPSRDAGGTATMEPPAPAPGAPAPPAPEAPPAAPRRQHPAIPPSKRWGPAAVGLSVQYHRAAGENAEGVLQYETLPATLARESKSEPGLWDMVVFLLGATATSRRTGVAFSPVPKANCWSFIPE